MYSRVINQTQHHLKKFFYSYNGLWNLPRNFTRKTPFEATVHLVKPLFFWSLSCQKIQTSPPPILFTSSALQCLLFLKLNCAFWISGTHRRQNFKMVRFLPSLFLVLLFDLSLSLLFLGIYLDSGFEKTFKIERLTCQRRSVEDHQLFIKFSGQFSFFPWPAWLNPTHLCMVLKDPSLLHKLDVKVVYDC